jgi:hypothetical protein
MTSGQPRETPTRETRPIRIANCSGFYGDRLSAAREMVDGGPIDVLTGDWLAELTMGILAGQRLRDPDAGYAKTFVRQLKDVLSDCLDRGIKIVSNAGGLNPEACAAQVAAIARDLGRDITVAVVTGDDATEAVKTARAAGWTAPHLDTGDTIPREPLLANAYLGGWGITEALSNGADVVVTGRVTDAALVTGPAAWHFGWARDDWDRLAGAVAAGHVIECGAQATGGNFSFFTEVPDLSRPGFPLAEISADGSSVISKHPGTGGAVTVDTVTAQLLYEVNGPRYLGPDVTTRLDTIRLTQEGPDRVRISGVRGETPPETVKVGALCPGGWKNEGTFVLTGLDIEAKAAQATTALWAHVPGGEKAFDQVTTRLIRADRDNPATMHEAVAFLTVTVTGHDPKAVAAFSRAAIETGLGSYPGLFMTAPPGKGSMVMVFWPTLLPAKDFNQKIVLVGSRRQGEWGAGAPHAEREASPWASTAEPNAPGQLVPHTRSVPVRGNDPVEGPLVPETTEPPDTTVPAEAPGDDGPTVRAPLGTLLAARSGDKAGSATLGVWTRNDEAHRWLRSWWTQERIRELIPETGPPGAGGLELRTWELPLLRACGVTIDGFLGAGVAANHALDGQAKALGEYLRAKVADIPASLVPHEH